MRAPHSNATTSSRRPLALRTRQLLLSPRGGARRGAGRKPIGSKPLVSHAARPELSARLPVLVTLKLAHGRPNLRRAPTRTILHEALHSASDRHGVRLVHFSVQSNHIHALVEAQDARALSRSMIGLCVRIARGLNRVWRSVGRVFADRFHARVLRTPREVRHALAYVLLNARKHGVRVSGIDSWSSGAGFDGWEEGSAGGGGFARVVVMARSWLLTVGWRRWGLVSMREVPGGAREGR